MSDLQRSTIDDCRRYARERGITMPTARQRRCSMARDWVDWCADNNLIPETSRNHQAKKSMLPAVGAPTPTQPPDYTGDAVSAHLAVEGQAYQAVQQLQDMQQAAIQAADSIEVGNVTRALDSSLKIYETIYKARREAELFSGRFVPMTMLEAYKSQFYPSLRAGVEALRVGIRNNLPESVRADFEIAWRCAYPAFANAAQDAENQLDTVRANAPQACQEEMLKRAPKIRRDE